MIWFYSRRNEELQIEICYDNDTSEYVMTIRGNKPGTTERFANVTAFRARLLQLEGQLEAEEWSGTGHAFLRSDSGIPDHREPCD